MADLNVNLNQTVSPKVLQRAVLLGRVKMAQAIQMREGEWAKVIADIEKDPLIRELLTDAFTNRKIIRYKPFKRTQISGQFYEMQDAAVVGGSGQNPEELLEKKKHLLTLIQKIGQDKFETFFLYREDGESLSAISKACGIPEAQAREVQDFVLEMSVQAEFLHPSSIDTSKMAKPTLVGRIVRNEDESFSMSFFSPHMARGQYEVNRQALKIWQKSKKLNRQESARVRKYVGMLELSNLKQGAFWRVLEYLLVAQKEFLETKDVSKMAPVSLRKVARYLQFAPSTISRVLGNKSVLLPWEREILISDLMPGQRRVVLSILEKMLNRPNPPRTDSALASQLKSEYGIRVSRRTVTACRHILSSSEDSEA